MKPTRLSTLIVVVTAAFFWFFVTSAVHADTGAAQPNSEWQFQPRFKALLDTAAFGLVGILLAIFGFKLFDWMTPGNLQQEVFVKQNVAAAVLGAAIMVGVCIIMAAAVHG